MTDEFEGEPPYWTRLHGGDKPTVYHIERDCRQLQNAPTATKRSENYLSYHDLRLCECCAGESNRPTEQDHSHAATLREGGANDD